MCPQSEQRTMSASAVPKRSVVGISPSGPASPPTARWCESSPPSQAAHRPAALVTLMPALVSLPLTPRRGYCFHHPRQTGSASPEATYHRRMGLDSAPPAGSASEQGRSLGLLSVAAPVFNEVESLDEFYGRVVSALE